jgi:quercetin dioxygenase-like cupin family protein
MNHSIIDREELPGSTASKFEGYRYGGANVSFFLSETPPGKGTSLHIHPYDEVFVVQEGTLTFTVGDITVEARGGQIVIAPANTPHRFVNSGDGRSLHIDIHTSGRMSTEWLDEEDRA